MSAIRVVAIITAKPGQRDAVLEIARANIPAVLAEEGCIEYAPTVDAEGMGGFQTQFGPDTFVFVEQWGSVDNLKAHAASEHMKAYGAKTKEMIDRKSVV